MLSLFILLFPTSPLISLSLPLQLLNTDTHTLSVCWYDAGGKPSPACPEHRHTVADPRSLNPTECFQKDRKRHFTKTPVNRTHPLSRLILQ